MNLHLASPFDLKRILAIGAAALLCAITGCKREDPGSTAWVVPGYTLLQQLSSRATNLIDSEGRIVHRWMSESNLGGGSHLLPDGTLLRSSIAQTSGPRSATPGLTGLIERLDWDGNRLWSFTQSADHNSLHHDIEPLPNGNILMLAVEQLSIDEQIALGRDPAKATGVLKLDFVLEIKPEGKEGGEIVWEWHLKDHLIQDFDKTKMNFGVVSEHPGKVDINFIENLKKMNASNLRVLQSLGYVSSTAQVTPNRTAADWTHANSVKHNAELDLVMLSVRSLSEIWIIDHGTTVEQAATGVGGSRGRGGRLLYRWGNPQAYHAGTPADQMLFGQHDAQWIQAGFPGAGNILIFNNGEGRTGGYSSIEEIKPPLRTDGTYGLEAGDAFGPLKPMWTYTAKEKSSFSSTFLSGVQRLKNGNTLICSGVQGWAFEVGRNGANVWEYKTGASVNRAPGVPGQRPQRGGKAMPKRPAPLQKAKPGGSAAEAAATVPVTSDGARGPATSATLEDGSEFTRAEIAFLMGREPPPGPPPGAAVRPAGAEMAGPPGTGAAPRAKPNAPGGGLFRATRYEADYPAFRGRNLVPLP